MAGGSQVQPVLPWRWAFRGGFLHLEMSFLSLMARRLARSRQDYDCHPRCQHLQPGLCVQSLSTLADFRRILEWAQGNSGQRTDGTLSWTASSRCCASCRTCKYCHLRVLRALQFLQHFTLDSRFWADSREARGLLLTGP